MLANCGRTIVSQSSWLPCTEIWGLSIGQARKVEWWLSIGCLWKRESKSVETSWTANSWFTRQIGTASSRIVHKTSQWLKQKLNDLTRLNLLRERSLCGMGKKALSLAPWLDPLACEITWWSTRFSLTFTLETGMSARTSGCLYWRNRSCSWWSFGDYASGAVKQSTYTVTILDFGIINVMKANSIVVAKELAFRTFILKDIKVFSWLLFPIKRIIALVNDKRNTLPGATSCKEWVLSK